MSSSVCSCESNFNNNISICLTLKEMIGYKFEYNVQNVMFELKIPFNGNPLNLFLWKRLVGKTRDLETQTVQFEVKYVNYSVYPSHVYSNVLPRFVDDNRMKVVITNRKDRWSIKATTVLDEHDIRLWDVSDLIRYYKTPSFISIYNYIRHNDDRTSSCITTSVLSGMLNGMLNGGLKYRLESEVELGVVVKPDLRAESKLDGESINVAKTILDNNMSNTVYNSSGNVSVTVGESKSAEHDEESKLDGETIDVNAQVNCRLEVEAYEEAKAVELDQQTIEKVWLGLSKLPMPRIGCLIKPRKEFDYMFEQLSKYVGLTEEIGLPKTGRVVAYIIKLNEPYTREFNLEYLIVIADDSDIESSLRHELLHVVEDLLELRYGTLTSLFGRIL